MRTDRGRTKKLIVAFHFQRANRAAWKCDTCRKSGLERKRNCGWLGGETPRSGAVWGNRKIVAEECPVSYINAESLSFIEAFTVWKLMGGSHLMEMPARTVEAFCLLEKELQSEVSDG